MVNQGPFRGCDACRNSHVKCDLQQPKCGRCIKRGTDCTGYQETLAIVIRDQTVSVSRRERLRAERRQRAVSTESPSPALSIPLLDKALRAFHLSYVPTPQKDGVVHTGYFDIVMQLSAGATSNTAISSAMPWLALHMIGIRAPTDVIKRKQVLLNRTLQALRSDLNNATAATQDQILATILTLDYGRSISHVCDERSDDMHLRGAIALINQRPIGSWNTPVGQRFLMWMRRNAIMHAICTRDHSIMLHDGLEDQLSQILSKSPATILDSYAARLVRVRAMLESGHAHSTASVRRLLLLRDDINGWCDRRPSHWTIQRVSNEPSPGFWGLSQFLFSSVHVAWFFSTCCALQIGIAALLLKHFTDEELDARGCPSRDEIEDDARLALDNLCATNPYLTGNLRHEDQFPQDAYDLAFGPDLGLDRKGSWFFMNTVNIVCSLWDINEETCAPALRGVLPVDQMAWVQKEMVKMQMLFAKLYGTNESMSL